MNHRIRHLAQENELNNLVSGSMAWFATQRELILSKKLLNHCYSCWYSHLVADEKTVPQSSKGKLLELGSGGSLLKNQLPELMTSDVVSGVAEHVIDGRSIPFDDRSLRAIFMTHVFHHIPDVETFLREAQRTLVPGGVISMIEVTHTPFARFFFKKFHHEPYVDDTKDWKFEQKNSMFDVNQAISWIVFKRDSEEFKRKFPGLKIECFNYLPWISYILSGGVTRKALLPNFLAPLALLADTLLKPLDFFAALHWHIRIRKI